ncbi:MAG: hypothetical protein EAX95_06125 [Candidatus Thorarchaeota archaeon]|nr:hypothetical protein [Candidatus Thorarchaeota archaeon]
MSDLGLSFLIIVTTVVVLAGCARWFSRRAHTSAGDSYGGIDRTRWVSIAALMTSLVLVGNYALVAIPNVELGTVVIFLTGNVFGFYMGAWCVLLSSVLFGVINPWGGLIPQIWITQVLGWFLVAFTGTLISEVKQDSGSVGETSLFFAFIGFALTLFFDLFTNLGYSWAFTIPYSVALLSGLPFMIVHVVTNGIIFAGLVPVTRQVIRRNFGNIIWDKQEDDLTHLGEE